MTEAPDPTLLAGTDRPAKIEPVDLDAAADPAQLERRLLALVDEDELTIPQAAARLGISRAKARRLYAGDRT